MFCQQLSETDKILNALLFRDHIQGNSTLQNSQIQKVLMAFLFITLKIH